MTAFKRGTTVQWKQSYINQTWVSFMLIVRFSKPEGVSVMKCNLCPFGGNVLSNCGRIIQIG